ncbi:hypothetical protein TEQG_08493 [Trichophyton equinum CBS 127.97]|uniref:Uncharacterized protein n=1 Tax=Trichophyton equinum (strain ATCC MYA-4606 / CBS 127.97) TaxID=559882 RepID=F2Q5Y2_TRIEC|nr:hypothetical protein TEQG_08493 [Trichophyton equinum CBS 127.97]
MRASHRWRPQLQMLVHTVTRRSLSRSLVHYHSQKVIMELRQRAAISIMQGGLRTQPMSRAPAEISPREHMALLLRLGLRRIPSLEFTMTIMQPPEQPPMQPYLARELHTWRKHSHSGRCRAHEPQRRPEEIPQHSEPHIARKCLSLALSRLMERLKPLIGAWMQV